VEFISDRLSHIILRGRWWNVIVLNVYTSYEGKSNDVKDGFCEKLQSVFLSFLATIPC
jgi:hypothetical protein